MMDRKAIGRRIVTISSTSSLSAASALTGTSLLTVLSDAASNAVELDDTKEIAAVNTQIQNRLNSQIAALQAPPDTAVTNALQNQISALQQQQTADTNFGPKYGANVNTLSNLQSQLATLQAAAGSGDSATFDSARSAANIDVQKLVEVTAPAPYQPDGVAGLLGRGLGIGDSASYDLSSPSGQAAAEAAVTSAQGVVQQVMQTSSSNQLIAGDLAKSLSTQIGNLQAELQQMNGADQTQVQAQIANLTQLAQNQEHLIELSLGNSQTIASVLAEAANPPQPITSVFGALEQAVAATPATYSSTQSAPAVLSLLT